MFAALLACDGSLIVNFFVIFCVFVLLLFFSSLALVIAPLFNALYCTTIETSCIFSRYHSICWRICSPLRNGLVPSLVPRHVHLRLPQHSQSVPPLPLSSTFKSPATLCCFCCAWLRTGGDICAERFYSRLLHPLHPIPITNRSPPLLFSKDACYFREVCGTMLF